MNSKDLIFQLGKQIADKRAEAEKKIAEYEEKRLMLQAAAVEYKVDAYNEVLKMLRDAMRDIERESRRTFVFESNLTDIEIKWV